MAMRQRGDRAPSEQLTLSDGTTVDLAAPGEILVLYFYPKAGTPVCTAQACAFRDRSEEIPGVRIVGISRDDIDSQRAFVARNRLPFAMASDPDGRLAREFGATLFGLPRRATFVVGQDGTIYGSFVNDLLPGVHVTAVERILRDGPP